MDICDDRIRVEFEYYINDSIFCGVYFKDLLYLQLKFFFKIQYIIVEYLYFFIGRVFEKNK